LPHTFKWTILHSQNTNIQVLKPKKENCGFLHLPLLVHLSAHSPKHVKKQSNGEARGKTKWWWGWNAMMMKHVRNINYVQAWCWLGVVMVKHVIGVAWEFLQILASSCIISLTFFYLFLAFDIGATWTPCINFLLHWSILHPSSSFQCRCYCLRHYAKMCPSWLENFMTMLKSSHAIIFLIMFLFCSQSLSFNHFHNYILTFVTMLQLCCNYIV